MLSHFTVSSSSDVSSKDPHAWEIQGSNDGVHFHTIFHRTNRDVSAWTDRDQVIRFDAGVHFMEPAAYRTVRVATHHYSNAGPALPIVLGELEFFGTRFESRITKMERLVEEAAVRLDWSSLPDTNYKLESSPELIAWKTIATGAITSFTDRTLDTLPDQLFYRITDDN